MGWTGEAERLEFQNRKSVETTMHDRRAFTDQETNDLATFLRSLSPIPVKRIDDPTILKGAQIFERLDCESFARVVTVRLCVRPREHTK